MTISKIKRINEYLAIRLQGCIEVSYCVVFLLAIIFITILPSTILTI